MSSPKRSVSKQQREVPRYRYVIKHRGRQKWFVLRQAGGYRKVAGLFGSQEAAACSSARSAAMGVGRGQCNAINLICPKQSAQSNLPNEVWPVCWRVI